MTPDEARTVVIDAIAQMFGDDPEAALAAIFDRDIADLPALLLSALALAAASISAVVGDDQDPRDLLIELHTLSRTNGAKPSC